MKKLVLLLASLFLLGGCSSEFIKEFSYTPKGGLDYDAALDPDAGSGGSSDQGGESGGEQGGGEQGGDQTDDKDEKTPCTYYIYLDYSHTTKYNPETKKDEDCPVVSFEVEDQFVPYGKVPEALADENGALSGEKLKQKAFTDYGFSIDPTFPKFLGLSIHGLCVDSSDTWDFTKDYMQKSEIKLYGVWYSDQLL